MTGFTEISPPDAPTVLDVSTEANFDADPRWVRNDPQGHAWPAGQP